MVNLENLKSFKAKVNNKIYIHYKKHKPNARQVCFDVLEKVLKKEKKEK